MLWLGVWMSCTLWNSPKDSTPPKPSILFLVSDTTRADAFQTVDTPNLDALGASEKGQVIEMAFAPSSWTSPSVLSMFTGQSVREHGWDYPIAQEMIRNRMEYPAISTESQTLAEVLGAAGYQTRGYIANRFLIRDLGFSRGFEEWQYMTDEELPPKVLKEFSIADVGESHFFYVHFFGPHQPLRPTAQRVQKYEIYEAIFGEKGLGFRFMKEDDDNIPIYKSVYDAVLEDTDERMGLVINAFLERFPDGRIVMTSDHGEMIGEHDEIGHKSGLYQELIHVPLIVYGDAERRIGPLFSLTSIADWLTDSVGVSAEWDAQWEPYAVSATTEPVVVSQRDGDVAFIRADRQKLVVDYPMTIQNGHFFQGTPKTYVFALSKDPKELRPLENEELETELWQQLEEWQEQREPGIADGYTNQTNRAFIKDLRKLGYVSDGK